MRRSGDGPRQMRRRQTDKADRPGCRRRRACQNHDHRRGGKPDPARIGAEALAELLPQRQRIQRPRQRQRGANARRPDRRRGPQHRPAAPLQRPHRPMAELIEDRRLGIDGDHPGQGQKHDRKRRPGQHQPHRIMPAGKPAEPENGCAAQSRPENARPKRRRHLDMAKDRDLTDDRQRRPGGNAQKPRIGQRIARQRLH